MCVVGLLQANQLILPFLLIGWVASGGAAFCRSLGFVAAHARVLGSARASDFSKGELMEATYIETAVEHGLPKLWALVEEMLEEA